MTQTPAKYDFIVVGGGPAGSAVAAGLSSAAAKPSVLLLEAGGPNTSRDLRVDGQRWTTFTRPGMNWGYKTSPQTNCNNRECDYSRGKGLGGSSAINFGVWSVGARDDYDEWSRRVGGDADFAWDAMARRYRELEDLDPTLPLNNQGGAEAARFANPDPRKHGKGGKLRVGYAAEWEEDLAPMLGVFEQAGGWPANPDHNSGDPLGVSVLINSARGGLRSTASDLLEPRPANLTVATDSPVERLVFDDEKDPKRVVGVVVRGGGEGKEEAKTYLASKEVVLSAGSLDGPKILMHSGIGPRAQLESFGVPVVRDAPGVGQGLRDHMFCPLIYTRKPGSTSRKSFYGSAQAMEDGLEEWRRDGTGPWSKYACELGIGWKKLPALKDTAEFQALPASEQKFLNQPTVPHYEVITHFPIHWFVPGFPDESLDYACLLVFYYNAQAKGQVTLQSSDPAAPLRFDPNFLGDAFDRRVAVDALRDALRVARTDAFARDSEAVMAGPAGETDEDLLEHWRNTISSSWHMTGTLKMGTEAEGDAAVVDPEFRLRGFAGLRVADMSVVPVLNNCHVQSVAYVTGMTCAEKLVREYNLA